MANQLNKSLSALRARLQGGGEKIGAFLVAGADGSVTAQNAAAGIKRGDRLIAVFAEDAVSGIQSAVTSNFKTPCQTVDKLDEVAGTNYTGSNLIIWFIR